jgi:RNA polymerase sigma-70 factor (ECF subfamily)
LRQLGSFPLHRVLARRYSPLMSRLDPQALVRHRDRLSRAARALCGSREEAEDLVQDTIAHVLARPRRLRGEQELAYLLCALRNTFVSTRRTAARHSRATATLDELSVCDPRADARAESALESHELFAAIEQLPDDFRRALVAVDVAGLSYREAADAFGTCEATIATRLHRARERVEDTLAIACVTAAPPARRGASTPGARR